MPVGSKKKVRPISASFGILDNYDQKTIPRPEEKSPETPTMNTFYFNKFVNFLLLHILMLYNIIII